MQTKVSYHVSDETQFVKPFIDRDEPGETSGVKIRFLHGGFEGTALKFSICFPAEEKDFQGRFFQYLSPFPGPDEEMASFGRSGQDDMIGFAVSHGAAFVESNMAASANFIPNADASVYYRSSAAVAELCRKLAKEKLGYEERVYGYVFGGSGGSYKTFACIEQTEVWDGAVPFVPGCPVALPNVIFVRAHALRVLRHKMDRLLDWVRPGADFDLFDELTDEEADALREVTAFGYPPEAWLQYRFAGDGSLPVLLPGVKSMDAGYFEDFWTKEGYLGAVAGSSAQKDRIHLRARVAEIHLPTAEELKAEEEKWAQIEADSLNDGTNGVSSAWMKMLETCEAGHPYIRIDRPLPDDPYDKGLVIHVLSGAAAGKTLTLGRFEGDRLEIGKGFGPGSVDEVLKALRVGDELLLDNSDYIALQTYHRHQVPGAEFKVWDQFRNPDGSPKYPQRPNLICYGFAYSGCGNIQTGQPTCKTITLSSLADESAFPWMAAWYDEQVSKNAGDEKGDLFRLYYSEHCYHGYQQDTVDPTTVTSYAGALFQALLDLSDWVELGVEPPRAANYRVEDGQVLVPKSARERGGLQATVELLADGGKRAEVRVDESLHFTARIELPDENTELKCAGASFEGKPQFEPLSGWRIQDDGSLLLSFEHRYDRPGLRFVTLQLETVRKSRPEDPYAIVKNIDSVRVNVI